jgi:aarF domain-containing kinase
MSDSPSHPPRRAPVPQGRTRRFLHLGRAVGEMAAGAAAEGLQQLSRGQRPELSRLMLTSANAHRLAERLSQMRGAVMKMGQLMSMDGQGVLPPQFAALLGGLRDRAHHMPATQLTQVLETEYGKDWHRRFRRFSFEPIAAASIGQVHRAETFDGRVLALKIQYPGVRRSIDSDIANLALLARTPGLVPAALDPAPLLERVRQQLHAETDYIAEARAATEYRARLGSDPVLSVPEVHADHSTACILATDFAPGVAIDRLALGEQPQARRDHVAGALCRLAVRELFQMRLVQTDPNFGNYLYDAASGRITLLDFGATEPVEPWRVEQLRELARALRDGDEARTRAVALAAGFIGADNAPAQAQGVVDLMMMSGEALRHDGPYDFGASDMFARVFERGRAQFFGAGYAQTPPPDLIFLQRKFAGTFMLCGRLRARVDVRGVFSGEI